MDIKQLHVAVMEMDVVIERHHVLVMEKINIVLVLVIIIVNLMFYGSYKSW